MALDHPNKNGSEPHYLAICRSHDGHPFLSNHLYRTDSEAFEEIGNCFVRLAKEFPAVMVIPKGEIAKLSLEQYEKIQRRMARGRSK